MHVQYILPQPAPQLLDRIEPRRIGRRPDRFDLRQQCQGCQHLRMLVDRPGILHDVDPLRRRVHLRQVLIQDNHFRPAYDVAIRIMHLIRIKLSERKLLRASCGCLVTPTIGGASYVEHTICRRCLTDSINYRCESGGAHEWFHSASTPTNRCQFCSSPRVRVFSQPPYVVRQQWPLHDSSCNDRLRQIWVHMKG